MHSNHLNSFFFKENHPIFSHFYLQSLRQPQTQFEIFHNYFLQNNFFPSPSLENNFLLIKKQNLFTQDKRITEQYQQLKVKSQIQEQSKNVDLQKNSKTERSLSRQKYGRNITSNIFRSLIRKICGQNHFKSFIQKIITNCHFQITYQIFVSQINLRCKNLNSYVRKNEMRSFWIAKNQTQREVQFCKIFRIACKKYFSQDHVLNVFYSKKINKESRQLHFAFCRQMSQLIKH